MSITISLTEEQVYTALRAFLLGVLPAGVEVVQAQTNRVSPPAASDYVTMTASLQERLSTNIDNEADALFMGSIAGTVLTISQVFFGAIGVGSPVFGVDVAAGTNVTALGTGSGGIGTYAVNVSQTVASQRIAAGTRQILMPAMATIQLDLHGPNSGDNSTIIAGSFRDEYAVQVFKDSGFDVAPLFTSDPKQMPFVNDSQQVEQRWVIDAALQINPILIVPQQYADAVDVAIIEVDAAYPPT